MSPFICQINLSHLFSTLLFFHSGLMSHPYKQHGERYLKAFSQLRFMDTQSFSSVEAEDRVVRPGQNLKMLSM